jgi:hypothetical protein
VEELLGTVGHQVELRGGHDVVGFCLVAGRSELGLLKVLTRSHSGVAAVDYFN